MEWLRQKLFALQDEDYREFQSRLMPTVPKEQIIGVRTPLLRGFVKEWTDQRQRETFLKELPHGYYEENNLHGFLIEQIENFDQCVAALERFLPYVDNWTTCDGTNPKVLKKDPERLLQLVKKWMAAKHPYTVRYGIGVLMRYFLEDRFAPEHLKWVAACASEEYYVNMMIAWYFATALAKQPEAAYSYVSETGHLTEWIRKKAMQKALESFRVSGDLKNMLRNLKLSCKSGIL